MSNTEINGLRVPDLTDSADITDAVGNLADDVDTRLFARFATPSARDSAITSPVPGMVCFVESFNLPMIYYTAYWGFFPGTPLALLYQSVAQSIADLDHPSILMDSEHFDLINGHSTVTNTDRYTPSIPGRYHLEGGVSFASAGGSTRAAQFYKNGGVVNVWGPENVAATPTGFHASVVASGDMDLNGTTDYVTLIGFQNSGGAVLTRVEANLQSTMRVTYMGPAS